MAGKAPHFLAVSGASLTVRENPREGFIRTPGRTHNRIRSPRSEASSLIGECR